MSAKPGTFSSPDSLLQKASALADLAFGAVTRPIGDLSGPRDLAFLTADALDLDLSDPNQRRIGDFELTEKLGQGGMGVVYRARQISLDREVALKMLSAGPWASRDFIERFHTEAQSAARLQHPNIVSIFEIGAVDELNYFAMQLVRGDSLAERLASTGPMASVAAARLLLPVAEAVDYAHSLGILHLDLKPSNILLDEDGDPLVADFGLARRLDRTLPSDSEAVAGTPSYMAPEQARARDRDLSPITDVYGLGAILYELLSGRPPFLGSSADAILTQVITVPPPPPSSFNREVSPDLEAICLKCLAKAPDDRYTSGRELAAELQRFLEGRPVSVRPLLPHQRIARWARREPKLAALAAMLLVSFVAGFVATSLQWQRAESHAASANELLWESRREAALRLTVDGRGFEAAELLASNLIEQERYGSDDVAADRRRLGLILNNGSVLIDRLMLEGARPVAVALSPQGRTLAIASDDSSLRWFDTAHLEQRGEVHLAGARTLLEPDRIPWLLRFAGEDRLLVTPRWPLPWVRPTGARMQLVDLAAARWVDPPDEFEDLADAVYSEDAEHALLRNDYGEVQLWRVEPWQALGPLQITEQPGDHELPSWLLGRGARIGARMLQGNVAFQFGDPRFPGSMEEWALPSNLSVFSWASSHDGERLALGSVAGGLFLLDRANMRRLPAPPGDPVLWVAFSEDDRWLAAAYRDGSAQVFDLDREEPLLGGLIQHDFEPDRIAVSRAHRLLLVSGEGRSALWWVPEPSHYPRRAIRLVASPAPADSTLGDFSIDWSPSTGLLAVAGTDGEISLWRLPESAMLPARAPRQIPASLHFDGRHVVDVAGNRLRLVSATNGAPRGDWLTLPQAPGFAELVAGGRTLVVTCGPALQIYDAPELQPRFDPITLPSSPLRMAVDPTGSWLTLAFGHAGADGFEEHVEVFDLRTGRRRESPLVLGGPLRQFDYGADGRQLVVTAINPERAEVFRVPGLTPVARYLPEPGYGLAAAALLPSGMHLAQFALYAPGLTVAEPDRSAGEPDRLLIWNQRAGTLDQRLPLERTEIHALAGLDRGALVLGASNDLLLAPGESPRSLRRIGRELAVPAFAVGGGRLIARALRGSVQLYDFEGRVLGAPLVAEISGHDAIALLAFSPDGNRLLARTALGRWLSWPIAPEMRRATDAWADLRGLPQRYPVTAENRAAWRERDRGPWLASEPRPTVEAAAWIGDHAVPARAPSTDPLLLDLTKHYSLAPDSLGHEMMHQVMDISGLPLGVQRIDGVDYDLRGAALMISASGLVSPYYLMAPQLLPDIAVPQVEIAGFHVLLLAYTNSSESQVREYMRLRLHYVDGTEATVPLRSQVEVPGWTGSDSVVPIGWLLTTTETFLYDGYQEPLSNPWVPNPYPDRLIATLDLEAGDQIWGSAPMILAITASAHPKKSEF